MAKNVTPSEDTKPAAGPTGGEAEDSEFKYIIRIANTDIDGHLTLTYGLSSIKGIGYRVACTITDTLNLSRTTKVGNLDDATIEQISTYVQNIAENIPIWMRNRQSDYETGEDLHLVSTDLSLMVRDDVNLMKKIRCYRGIRHEGGHKVRGQRTKSNGRHGLSLGVSRRKQ